MVGPFFSSFPFFSYQKIEEFFQKKISNLRFKIIFSLKNEFF
jgi:hypothetical protein